MHLSDVRRLPPAMALGAALLVAGAAVLPAQAGEPGPQAAGELPGNLRPELVGPFLDRVLEAQLAWAGIPGAAVALVAAGELLYLGGYGKADLASGRPVSAAETLFQTGSVSKLFTATAVIQLLEQGRLDLHADVNGYLARFQVPPTYPQPVTVAHLLTHTAGFEERAFGAYARSAERLLPLGKR